jgi:BirA family biotin operon repressor/biotin-[acetyl-CoA-carboxylase] ligase
VDTTTLREYLADLPLGWITFIPVLGSTNTEGVHWLEQGAPHFSLIAADEQTAGRGRLDRRWYTAQGTALAFSLILRLEPSRVISVARLTGLGALAVCDVLQSGYQLPAQIKWPNDVLVGGSKVAGVLVDAQWQGDETLSAVLGIGINVARKSVPSQGELDFPATSVEAEQGDAVERWWLLKEVLKAVLFRYSQLNEDVFIEDWEANLAYRGKSVQILRDGTVEESGRVQGLNDAGHLRLTLPGGEEKLVAAGDVRLRHIDMK